MPKGYSKGRINGEFFETLIELSCRWYKDRDVAYIQKTPEPMKPIRALDRTRGHYMAIYTKSAQPDFTGTLSGGQSVMFEAKHTEQPRIEFDRISPQQEMDLTIHSKLGAMTFVLVSVQAKLFYRIPFEDWMQLKRTIGKKSLNQGDMEKYKLRNKGRIIYFLD